MTIKIEIPSDNPIIALAFGKALCEIGGQPVSDELPEGKMRVYTAPGGSTVQNVKEIVESHVQLAKDGASMNGPFYWVHHESEDYGISETWEHLNQLIDSEPLVEQVTKEVYDKLSAEWSQDVPPPATDNVEPPKLDTAGDAVEKDESAHVETDINGYPWDERIHSKNKSKNADGTWRYCRMPKNFDGNKEAWQVFIEQIEAELKPTTDDVPPPPVTETAEEADPTTVFGGDVTPPVVETEDVTPPPVVEDTATYPEKSFPQLMTLVTSNRQNGSIEKIEQVLAEMGITSENGKPVLAVLNMNHKDRVSEAYAKLEGEL